MAQAVGDLGDDLQNFVHQFVEALHCVRTLYFTILYDSMITCVILCRFLAVTNCHMKVFIFIRTLHSK